MTDDDFQSTLESLVVGGLSNGEGPLKNLADSYEPSTKSIKLLADTCRIPEWRQPLAEAGFLEAVLDCGPVEQLANHDQDKAFQILRFICNSVADTDDNRTLTLPHILDIFQTAAFDKLRVAALSAILNICQDYEAGSKELVRVLPDVVAQLSLYVRDVHLQLLPTILSIIGLLIPVLPPAEHKDSYEKFLFKSVLAITNAPGATSRQDDFLSCMDSLTPILQNEEVQVILAKDMSECINLLENCLLRLTGRKRLRAKSHTPAEDEDEDEDIEVELAELNAHADSLVGILASISFHVTFEDTAELLGSEDVQDMVRWLSEEWKNVSESAIEQDSDNICFARAGALVLGNIATQEWIVKDLVNAGKVVPAAITAILDSTDRELRSAAAGLLHNLSIPSTSKPVLQKAGAFRCVALLLSATKDDKPDVEVCLSGLKLLRVLLLNSPENCRLFVKGEDMIAQTALVELLLNEDVADARIRTEAGRALVAMYRSMAMPTPTESKPGLHDDSAPVYQIPEAVGAVFSLITHPDPRNKSQGWMGLAILSQSSQGAQDVHRCFTRPGNELRKPFEELLNQKESADQPMREKDKDNALVLMANLLRETDTVSESEKAGLKELMSLHGKSRAS